MPIVFLFLRQALGFSFKEETGYEFTCGLYSAGAFRKENPPAARKYEPVQAVQKTDPVFKEEMVERIAASIRQTAATGSHFSKMLSPEEEEIMREIIREFME